MEYTVYVLQDTNGRLYKGFTTDLEKRLAGHHSGNTRTTSLMAELDIAYTKKFDSFEDARKRELYFKSAAGRRFLKKKMGR